MNHTLIEKTFKDSDGNVVIGQSPNLPLLGFLMLGFGSVITHDGATKTRLRQFALLSLFTWSSLETVKGVDYFRKGTGAFVSIAIVWLHIRSKKHSHQQ